MRDRRSGRRDFPKVRLAVREVARVTVEKQRDESIAVADLPRMDAYAIGRVEPHVGRAHTCPLIPKPVRIL